MCRTRTSRSDPEPWTTEYEICNSTPWLLQHIWCMPMHQSGHGCQSDVPSWTTPDTMRFTIGAVRHTACLARIGSPVVSGCHDGMTETERLPDFVCSSLNCCLLPPIRDSPMVRTSNVNYLHTTVVIACERTTTRRLGPPAVPP